MSNNKLLGKEFDKCKSERIMRNAGIITEQAKINEYLEKLRKEGKLAKVLDHYNPEINRKLGKQLFKP